MNVVSKSEMDTFVSVEDSNYCETEIDVDYYGDDETKFQCNQYEQGQR